jgi:hypothetical protein
MSATADQELAELRRAYEEMRSERDAAVSELQTRTAALARRDSEFGERIQHQSATIDVLKAMSASPGDPQPVFDLITRRAQELCDGTAVGLFTYDGKLVHLALRSVTLTHRGLPTTLRLSQWHQRADRSPAVPF